MNIDYGTIPASEIAARIKRLQKELLAAELDGALISHQMDLVYFSGTGQSAILVIPTSGAPRLLVRRTLTRAQAETSIEHVEPFHSMRDLIPVLKDVGLGPGAALGVTLDTLPAWQYVRLQELLQPGQIDDVSQTILRLRSRKSDWELEQYRQTVPLARSMYETVCETLRPGMSELELAAAVEANARRQGHQGLLQTRNYNQRLYWGLAVAGNNSTVASSFEGIASGPGLSVALPQGSTHHRIIPGEPVLVDLAAVTNGYIIDHTRIFSLGPLPDDIARAQSVAEHIYYELLHHLQPGVTGEELYEMAVSMATKAGLGDYFMGYGADRVPFIGHGIGLELDEWPALAPRFREPLAAGTVIALEPKFILPGRGLAGLENTIAVTDHGPEVFGYEPNGLTVL